MSDKDGYLTDEEFNEFEEGLKDLGFIEHMPNKLGGIRRWNHPTLNISIELSSGNFDVIFTNTFAFKPSSDVEVENSLVIINSYLKGTKL